MSDNEDMPIPRLPEDKRAFADYAAAVEPGNMDHMDHLESVAASDLAVLREKESTYQGSWKRRGGKGAWHVGLCRTWDRLEYMVRERYEEDVFEAIEAEREGEDGTPLAALRDLRRYLILVEAEMIARGKVFTERPNEALDPGDLVSALAVIEGVINALPAKGHVISPLRDRVRTDLLGLARRLEAAGAERPAAEKSRVDPEADRDAAERNAAWAPEAKDGKR